MNLASPKSDASSNAVEVAGLSYQYAGRTEPSLVDISFALSPGSCTLLAGSTGSGKSTLLAALAGLIPHHRRGEMLGQVKIFGSDTRSLPPEHKAAQVGLVLQSPDDQLCTTRVWAEVAFGLESLGVPADEIPARIQAALAQVGLSAWHDARTSTLSGGQKQRLLWAAALAMRPKLLLLDEPLSQLDPAAAAEFLTLLQQLRTAGHTVIVSEHRLEDMLPVCDELLVLKAGKLHAQVPATNLGEVVAALGSAALHPPDNFKLAHAYGCETLQTIQPLAERIAQRVHQPVRNNDVPEREHSSPLLTVRNLAFSFPGTEEPVWQQVNFQLHAGDRVAVIGGNGSGKSTLLANLAGLLTPTAGEIVWDSETKEAADTRALPTGLVLQNPDLMLFCQSVRDELAYAPRQLQLPFEVVEERVAQAEYSLGLAGMMHEPPLGLSQGQRLRCAVAATLTLEPRLLLLDEPTTGQDPQQVERMMRTVTSLDRAKSRVAAVLFSTHDLRTVLEFATRVLVLGRKTLLADGTPAEVLEDQALLEEAQLRRPFIAELLMQLRKLAKQPVRSRTAAEVLEEFAP